MMSFVVFIIRVFYGNVCFLTGRIKIFVRKENISTEKVRLFRKNI